MQVDYGMVGTSQPLATTPVTIQAPPPLENHVFDSQAGVGAFFSQLFSLDHEEIERHFPPTQATGSGHFNPSQTESEAARMEYQESYSQYSQYW
jgi:hypothetical protein